MSSRDSLPFVSTCTINGNEFFQLVAFVVLSIHFKCLAYDTWTKEIESTLGAAFARDEKLASPIRADLMLIKLVLPCV